MYEGPSRDSSGFRKSRIPTPKLIIEGLHYEVTEAELKHLFEQIAPVQKLIVKYDRSGRPTGTAIVIYGNARDAEAARTEYDGANAKGQPITISFEEMRNPGGRRAVGSGQTASAGAASQDLRSRMDLLSRMGGERQLPPPNAPTGPSGARGAPGAPGAPRQPRAASGSLAGGQRTRESGVRGVGGRNAGGVREAGRGGGASQQQREKRTPKTASDLDAELDAFMKAPKGSAQSAHAPADAAQDGDVEM
ncbi:hypothetical protein BDZ90DRAFT_229950, partial [Jaminaea rosea]